MIRVIYSKILFASLILFSITGYSAKYGVSDVYVNSSESLNCKMNKGHPKKFMTHEVPADSRSHRIIHDYSNGLMQSGTHGKFTCKNSGGDIVFVGKYKYPNRVHDCNDNPVRCEFAHNQGGATVAKTCNDSDTDDAGNAKLVCNFQFRK